MKKREGEKMEDEKNLSEETIEETKETDGKDKESSYENYCQMCRRPESIAGKMIQLPNDFCVCNDCLQKTFDSINGNGFPYMEMLTLDPSMFRMGGDFMKMPKVKKKAKPAEQEKKDGEEQPVLDLKNLKAPHKIKAELVRSGQHVPGYTDDVNVEVLSEALGSETLARAVEDSFAKADVPVTAETVKQVSQAWDMAKTLEGPTDGTYRYMIDNALAPEIGNLYMAQSSGAGAGEVGRSGYYAEDVQGYFAQSAVIDSAVTEEDVALLEQMDKVILQAGMEENEESTYDTSDYYGGLINLFLGRIYYG